jgi:hypothetical protein
MVIIVQCTLYQNAPCVFREIVGHSFAFLFYRIRIQRAAAASRHATYLATHLAICKTCFNQLSLSKSVGFIAICQPLRRYLEY